MGKKCQVVMGPAGAGKSTYCHALVEHCEEIGRSVHVINLDPAAEEFKYPVSIDIRDLISVEDAMEGLNLGPNGGLVYCMEYLLSNVEWLADQIGDYVDDYLIFDCPGQIELYTHVPVMTKLVRTLESWGYQICGLYLLDAHYVNQPEKFIAGSLMCLSCMMQLEIPHINVLTKMDIISREKASRDAIDSFLDMDVDMLLHSLNSKTPARLQALNVAMAGLLESFNMVSFIPLDLSDPESISHLLLAVDTANQYDEDVEPRDPGNDEDFDEDDGGDADGADVFGG